MINFILCDDNLKLLEKLEKILTSIFKSNNIQATISCITDNPYELINYVSNNNVNVVILDVQLNSNINGIELAKEIRKINKNCYIIFTTAHLEYSLIAYKVKTFDYIPKPITQVRLEDTILRLIDDINGDSKKYIKIDNKNTVIDENEILYIKRDGMKLVFHTDTKDYDTYSSFNKIQNFIPDNFIRCHKSYIVNINKIVNFDPVSNTIFFRNSHCEIGPKYKQMMLEVINTNEFKKSKY